jgi:hypothetical protein
MTKVKLTIIAFAILIPLMVGVGSAFSAGNQKDCEDLKAYVESLTDEALVRPITNVQAIWNSTYCEVRGRIFPETDFAVRLPTNWNGRTIHFGGGG